jgi:hypothetical protein
VAALLFGDSRRPMASKNPQTMAKRAREQAVKERRDRKRAKKAEAAAVRAAAREAANGAIGGEDVPSPDAEGAQTDEVVARDR